MWHKNINSEVVVYTRMGFFSGVVGILRCSGWWPWKDTWVIWQPLGFIYLTFQNKRHHVLSLCFIALSVSISSAPQGILLPKNSLIIYSRSCRSKPVWCYFSMTREGEFQIFFKETTQKFLSCIFSYIKTGSRSDHWRSLKKSNLTWS